MTGNVEEDRVLLAARGMVWRDVEGLEVVPVRLDLRSFDDPIPHPREYLDDANLERGERVHGPVPRCAAGQRHVDAIRLHERRLARRRELGPARLEQFAQRETNFESRRAELASAGEAT